MKKIAITLLIGYSLSFSSECEKLQIDELKYMTKEELVESYKMQNALYKINMNTMDSLSEISEQQASLDRLSTAINSKSKFKNNSDESYMEKLENNSRCYTNNKTNIKRVLEKDFNLTEEELNKLITN